MARNPYYSGPRSDHFDGLRFFNPARRSTDRSVAQLLRWQMGGGKERWTRPPATQPAISPDHVAGLSVTMIGHASVLIQVQGRNLLVDPVWSERASPLSWAGPKRFTRPGIDIGNLPPIDAVLVTHNHYDHMDLRTLALIQAAHRPLFITALGNDVIIRRALPPADIVALDWHASTQIAGDLTVTGVPANHWSARGMGDRRMALWCGFLIRTPAHLVYNVGDTGYGDGKIFRDLRTRYGAPDVAVIPIGAYEPRWFMADQHVDPDEAVRLLLDCGAAHGLGVHWGTFQLTNEGREAPRGRLAGALLEQGMSSGTFVALQPGEVWSLPREHRTTG